MKKILCLIMIGCFALSGCGNSTTAPSEQTIEEPEEVQDKIIEEIKPEEPIKIENPDFRNTKWGMTMEEVKASENGLFIDGDEEIIAYSVDVAGYPATAVYEFKNDSLDSAFYQFECEHANENLWIDDYNDLKEKFTIVYGEPLKSEENWKNDLFKDSPDDYGLAVAAGDLTYISAWKTETTQIGIMLIGDNYEIQLGATYFPINHEFEKNTDGI